DSSHLTGSIGSVARTDAAEQGKDYEENGKSPGYGSRQSPDRVVSNAGRCADRFEHSAGCPEKERQTCQQESEEGAEEHEGRPADGSEDRGTERFSDARCLAVEPEHGAGYAGKER